MMLIRIFISLGLIFYASCSLAEEIPIIVISANKSVQSKSTVGSDIKVLNSETIEGSSSNFIGEIINEEISGANYFQSGGHGTQSGIQLRGLPKRYSTVYIDGVRMSDPSSPDNSFYMSNVMKESIEKVEILKGSQSSLYGSNAIGGTINIFTKKAKEGQSTNYNISRGSNGSINKNFSYSSANQVQDFYIGLNSFNTDGISAMNDSPNENDKDSYDNKSIAGNYGYKLNENLNFRGSFRFSDSFLNYDEVTIGRDDTNNNSKEDELSYNLRLNQTNNKFKNTLIYNYTEIKRFTNTFNNTKKNYYGYRDALNFIGQYNFNFDNKLIYGLDNEFDNAKFQKDWPTDYLNSDESIHSQYIDLMFRPSTNLYQTFGVRKDYHTTAGSHNTYRGTLAYNLNNFSKLRASYGTGIRFPSLYDYFYGSSVSNKETLKPEKSKSFDIGYEKYFKKQNINFDISFFHITYDDPLEGWQSHGWKIKNADGEITSKGFEVSSNWKINNNQIKINYGYTDTYDGADCDDPNSTSIDCAMVRVPRHNFNAAFKFKSKNNIYNKFNIKYSGETRDYGNANNSFSDIILDDYIVFNYQANYNYKDKYNLYLNAENIFNENYEQAYQYSTMGRSFNIGVKVGY